MNVLIALTERIISKLKNDSSYRIRREYELSQLLKILWYRGLQVFRGLLVKVRLRHGKGLVLAGRRVTIEFPNMISFGTGLIIEDDVFLSGLSEKGIIFGRNVTIGKKAIIVCTGVVANKGVGLVVGDNVAVGSQSFIGAQGGIFIGDDVIMGPGVKIFSENHCFADLAKPIRKQGEIRKGVRIESNCWIGANATILDGVTIKKGSVVAAGAVVTCDIQGNSVVGGIPAKLLKMRTDE